MKNITKIGLIILAIIAIVCIFTIGRELSIDSYEECVAAGNPILESWPPQCITRLGKHFTGVIESQPVQKEEIFYCTEEEIEAQICTMEYMPVCGDNGVTYGNECTPCASGNIKSYTVGECENEEPLIGGERDQYGCLGSAGYSWDEEIGACIRSWELDKSQREAAKIAVAPLSYRVTVVEVLTLKCPGCFHVTVQRNDNQHQSVIRLADLRITTAEPGASLTEAEATAIAQGTECTQKASLTDNIFYNENSKTWWIDLDMKPEYTKAGCSPACVVFEETQAVEINWRCTGLVS